jgi:hypothetical protein
MDIGQIWLMASQRILLTLLGPPNGHLGNLPLELAMTDFNEDMHYFKYK